MTSHLRSHLALGRNSYVSVGRTPVPVFVPVAPETQIEYTEWSDTLRVLLQYEVEYI